MAKVPFSKLQANINMSEKAISYANKSGEEIKYEVKYYLPIKDKLSLVSNVLNQAVDNNGFYNPMRVKIYLTLEIVYAYTNLSFTEKMKEDPFKMYDVLVSTGIYQNIIDSICKNDLIEINESVWDAVKSIYQYRNSAVGILEAVANDYGNLDLNATEIQQKLADPENLELLKSVLTKLG